MLKELAMLERVMHPRRVELKARVGSVAGVPRWKGSCALAARRAIRAAPSALAVQAFWTRSDHLERSSAQGAIRAFTSDSARNFDQKMSVAGSIAVSAFELQRFARG